MTRELADVPITTALLRGVVEVEETPRGLALHRLPAYAVAQAADPQLAMAESQPAGCRLALRTSATVVELDVIATKREYVGAPRRPDGVFELVVDGEAIAQASVPAGDTLVIDMTTGGFEHREGPPATVRFDDLPAYEKDVEIWLPHDETNVLVALRADASVTPIEENRPVWVHHGSSISHGSNATHPLGTWPVVAARRADVDLLNLGFGGSALLDQFVARTIRDLSADVISVKLGINIVNQDLMRRRAFRTGVHGFLDTIRDGHPETPLVVISPVLCPIHEQVPGPSMPDMSELAQGRVSFLAGGDAADVAAGKLTLSVIRDELASIVAERSATDPHLVHLDGRELYGDADAEELPLPDRLHPDGPSHERMGERFAALGLATLRRRS